MIILGKIKVTELAKKLNIEPKKLLNIAKENGIEIKSNLSSVTEDESIKLEKLIKGVSRTKSMENKKEKMNSEQPFIIRRSVTVNNDEEQKKLEEEKQKKRKRKK